MTTDRKRRYRRRGRPPGNEFLGSQLTAFSVKLCPSDAAYLFHVRKRYALASDADTFRKILHDHQQGAPHHGSTNDPNG